MNADFTLNFGRKDEAIVAAVHEGGYSALLSVWVLSRWLNCCSYEFGSNLDPSCFSFLLENVNSKLDLSFKEILLNLLSGSWVKDCQWDP